MNIIIALLLMLPLGPTCGTWSEGFRSTKEIRHETKQRIDDTARRMGASADARRVLAAMAMRESHFDSCAEHTLGRGEFGLGPFGLSVRWTLGIWNDDAEPEVLKIPEVATVVALRIYRRAVRRHGVKTWRGVNSVFATGKLKIRPAQDNAFCHRLKMRGIDCEDDPTGQLGKVLGLSEMEEQERILEEMK